VYVTLLTTRTAPATDIPAFLVLLILSGLVFAFAIPELRIASRVFSVAFYVGRALFVNIVRDRSGELPDQNARKKRNLEGRLFGLSMR
jgi:hypothetical protein